MRAGLHATALPLALALAAAPLLACQASKAPSPPLAAKDAGTPAARAEPPAPDAGRKTLASAAHTWPRMRADRFGCLLERELKVRDRRFNCSIKGYVNKGDPCKETEAYSEGPAIPDSVVDRLDPDLASVSLSWEHGELQQAILIFDGVLTQAEAFQRAGLPETGQPLPANIQRAKVEACSRATTCVTLEGFDHTGAGDVDCGE